MRYNKREDHKGEGFTLKIYVMGFQLNRKKILVPQLPNATWGEEELVDLGVREGVIFHEDGMRVDNPLRLNKATIIEQLWEQREFELFQSPMEESKGQKASVLPQEYVDTIVNDAAVIRYIGPYPIVEVPFGRNEFRFVRGIDYRIRRESDTTKSRMELAHYLQRRDDFEISFEVSREEDSLLTVMRQIADESEHMQEEYEESTPSRNPWSN